MRIAALGDLHVPFHDADAVEAACTALRWWKPDVLIMLGDVVDFYQLSRFDRDPNRTLLLQEDIDKAVVCIAEIRKAARKAELVFIEGNHEQRLAKWLHKHAEIASLRSLKLQELLQLSKFEPCTFVRWNEIYMPAPDFVATHGEYARKWAGQTARAMAEKYLCNGVSGHCHRLAVTRWVGVRQLVWAEAGCLCSLTPEYTLMVDWHHGCVLGEMEPGRLPRLHAVAFDGPVPQLPTAVRVGNEQIHAE